MDTTRDLLFSTGQPNFEGFIFDFDGTIADSMEVWYWVDQEFLERRHLDPRQITGEYSPHWDTLRAPAMS